ncbi:MAG TPA: alpha-1,2-fucosyltransferase [Xanthobacteraceae bacterium]|jgi:hypothetical protein
MNDTPRKLSGVLPMVLVTLRGGLGNQMFQYAIGRSIAEKHGRRLVLDDLALEVEHLGRTKRSYALGVFDIDAELTSQVQLEQVQLEKAATQALLMQELRGFHQEVLNAHPEAQLQLQGFWQNEKYFADIAPLLRGQFRMKPGPWDASPWRPAIETDSSAVCVHVRRQDYLKEAGAALGFIGRDYYERATTAIARAVPDCHFFFFSDDIPWCKENLSLGFPSSFVAHSDQRGDFTYTDFRLMTLCRHFIVANSSFSWWAAWLGSDPRKIVIAPKIWFRELPFASADIVPAAWLRM